MCAKCCHRSLQISYGAEDGMFKSGSYVVCVFTDKYELARLRRSEAIFQPLRISVLGSLRNVEECICEGLPVRGKGALRLKLKEPRQKTASV